jgi:N-acetyl-anhydromuramyl-L-alanine amidase AmpD
MAGNSVEDQVKEIKRWHIADREWTDIGYHLIVGRNGKTVNGRPMARNGAHTMGRNKNTVGICLIGGHGSAETDKFSDNFTPEQDRALRQILRDLSSDFPGLKISGHNQWAKKACPGFYVPHWIKEKSQRRSWLARLFRRRK